MHVLRDTHHQNVEASQLVLPDLAGYLPCVLCTLCVVLAASDVLIDYLILQLNRD